MNFQYSEKQENSAYVQLLILLGYALVGILICSVLGVLVLFGMYGSSVLTDSYALATGDPKFLNGLKIFQVLSSIGLFLAPPILLAWTEKRKVKDFYQLRESRSITAGWVLLIMFASMPLMEWTALWNQQLHLPESMKAIESWMKEKEETAMRTTLIFLKMNHLGDFLINLLVIAVLPAIAEELMFRGGIQRAFKRMFSNHHVAIWVTAIVFSAIHLQFYGFLPRVLLGALFGYIYVWSGNLWYAILAHFINNAYAVCVAYYLQLKHLPLSTTDQTFQFAWYGYLLSGLVSVALLFYFKKQFTNGKQLGESI